MKDGWENLLLGSVCDVFSGFAFKSDDLGDEGIPVLKIANIKGKKVLSECKDSFLPSKIDDKLTKYILQDDDILIAMTGAGSVGKVGKMRLRGRQYLVNQRVAIVRLKSDNANAEFIYQALSQDKYETILYNIGLGAGQPNISPEQIRNLIILSPNIDTQNKIALILSVYDDLIENNTRRIKILEEMARLIYREWFIEWRIPNYELRMRKATLEEKKVTGKDVFPEGWELHKFTDLVIVNPNVKIPKEGLKPFIPMGGLTNDSMLITEYELREGNSGFKFKNNDTLFARITPCLENGKTAFVQFLEDNDSVAFGSTEFIVLRSKLLFPELVYLISRDEAFRNNAIKSMSGATGRQRVQEECFNKFLFPLPYNETLKKCQNILTSLFKQSFLLAKKNQNLHQTRDLLLPKLISGEVEV